MKFILTRELGRLARWLRILGFDAEYCREEKAGALLVNAFRHARIILTRKTKFPHTHAVKVIHINSDDLKQQLSQIIEELNLQIDKDLVFSRCVICNIELEPIKKEKIKDKVPEYVYNTQRDFFICSHCKRIYWQGTHWGNVEKIIEKLSL